MPISTFVNVDLQPLLMFPKIHFIIANKVKLLYKLYLLTYYNELARLPYPDNHNNLPYDTKHIVNLFKYGYFVLVLYCTSWSCLLGKIEQIFRAGVPSRSTVQTFERETCKPIKPSVVHATNFVNKLMPTVATPEILVKL